MTEENEYTTIRISNETKELFEKKRKQIPYEQSATAEQFILYLLKQTEEKKK